MCLQKVCVLDFDVCNDDVKRINVEVTSASWYRHFGHCHMKGSRWTVLDDVLEADYVVVVFHERCWTTKKGRERIGSGKMQRNRTASLVTSQ